MSQQPRFHVTTREEAIYLGMAVQMVRWLLQHPTSARLSRSIER